MVKWKMDPFPGSLETQMRPPINSTSWEVMASPSPVPPNRRVIDESACVNASKIEACFSSGMPIPVSVTVK